MKTARKLAPLWITYLVLFVISVSGPLFTPLGGLWRGHWAFLFLLPFTISSVPLSFILGEIIQLRTRSSARFAWRLCGLHILAFFAIFLVGMFDFLAGTSELLYFVMWLFPSVLSGLFLVLGMHVMRHEQARSDARYGVEVRRGDPWSSFFDLTWEGAPTDTRSRAASTQRVRRPSRRGQAQAASRSSRR